MARVIQPDLNGPEYLPMRFEEDTTLVQDTRPIGKKYFTVEEANCALPYVSRVIDDVIIIYSDIVDLRRLLEHDDLSAEASQIERKYEQAMDRLGALVDELHAVGVELKDFERGLVDFPSIYEDREVLLCWHRGEDHVGYWHELDAGFGGRQSVDLLTQQV